MRQPEIDENVLIIQTEDYHRCSKNNGS